MGKEHPRWKVALSWMVSALIVWGVFILNRPDTRTDAEIQAAENRDRRDRLIAWAMVEVRGKLRDPSSADFGKVFVSEKSGEETVCGGINAKNSFGGYTGMQPFVIAVAPGRIWIDDLEAWGKHCAE